MSLDFDPNTITFSAAHLIDGKRVEDGGGDQIAVARPSDGAPSAPIHAADEALVDRAVSSAATAFRMTGWPEASPLERAAVLKRWADLLDRDRIRIAQIEAASTTRPIEDMVNRDLVRAAGAIRYFAEWADKVEGQIRSGQAGTTSMSRLEPYGVVASIAPFNFPAINAVWKSAPALAVGNAVVLKPSELTPYSALAIAELALEAGLPRRPVQCCARRRRDWICLGAPSFDP